LLSGFGVKVRGCLAQMGDIKVQFDNWQATNKNPFFAACNKAAMQQQLADKITQLRRDGDSCGAIVHVNATGIPPGWGEPVFDRLDADIAKALMSINAVKGVEIGAGFGAATMCGSEHNDEITPDGFMTNHSGGILGGISSGQDINARIAIKPTSSIRIPRRTITKSGKATKVQTTGRHDPCVGIRAVPVAEAMLMLILADHALRHRAQCGGKTENMTKAKPAKKQGTKQ
ncbi:MAG: chorismate synthase, partial [Gammaproteobacteria bacterium]